jgi:hypothetical protein
LYSAERGYYGHHCYAFWLTRKFDTFCVGTVFGVGFIREYIGASFWIDVGYVVFNDSWDDALRTSGLFSGHKKGR